ncbi:hypothetical protein SCG7086_BQ_00120, partial [Chlamydiales bacterium SCGC AG-110-P3]
MKTLGYRTDSGQVDFSSSSRSLLSQNAPRAGCMGKFWSVYYNEYLPNHDDPRVRTWHAAAGVFGILGGFTGVGVSVYSGSAAGVALSALGGFASTYAIAIPSHLYYQGTLPSSAKNPKHMPYFWVSELWMTCRILT